MLTSKKG